MASLTIDDARLLLGARMYLYELAHTVFGGEPDAALVEALTSETADQALVLAMDGQGDPYDHLRASLVELGALPVEEAVVGLRSAHMRLVEGPDLHDAYPWESMYVSHRRLLFQKSTLEVRGAYREFGYELQEHGKVPDDHLSLECAFMAKMATRTLEAFDSAMAGGEGDLGSASEELLHLLDGQERFLCDHAGKWFSRYAADLSANDGESLYARVACMIAAFVEDDRGVLEAVRTLAFERVRK